LYFTSKQLNTLAQKKQYKLRFIFPIISLLQNNSQYKNPKFIRYMQYALIYINSALFLNVFIYLFYKEGLSGEMLYLVVLPMIVTSLVNGPLLGGAFNHAKRQLQSGRGQSDSRENRTRNLERANKLATIIFGLICFVNIVGQVILTKVGDMTKAPLDKQKVEFTQGKWLTCYIMILILDTIADMFMAILCFLAKRMGGKKETSRILKFAARRGFAECETKTA
jgi:hypothetical protein